MLLRDPLLKSPYFKTALESQWIEGRNNIIKLKEDDSEIVRHYIHWLYAATLPRAELTVLSKLYVLGDKFVDIAYKIAVVLAILREVEDGSYPIGEPIDTIYDGTFEGSLGRKLMVDLVYLNGEPGWVEHNRDNVEFMTDLAVKGVKMRHLNHHPQRGVRSEAEYMERPKEIVEADSEEEDVL
jgi:hypothetical protein